jgi:hypothetical protein
VPPVRYELGFYIPKDDILHCRRENFKFFKYNQKYRVENDYVGVACSTNGGDEGHV